jgi:gamma-glutamylcyclotransferase (GGCT)/AIG2-like uncharacterized protein YtfP
MKKYLFFIVIIVIIGLYKNMIIKENYHTLFVYGTLMSKSRVLSLIKRIPKYTNAILKGYHNSNLKGVNYPGANLNEGSTIYGILFLDLNEKEIVILDDYEGDEYKKENISLILRNNDTFQSIFYKYIGNKEKYGIWNFNDHFNENDRIK